MIWIYMLVKQKKEIVRQEEMLANDKEKLKGINSDVAWDSEHMREIILQKSSTKWKVYLIK